MLVPCRAGKLTQPDFRAGAFNYHAMKGITRIIKRIPSLYGPHLMCPWIIPLSPPTAPWGHLSCYDASSTGERTKRQREVRSLTEVKLWGVGHSQDWLRPRPGLLTPPWHQNVFTTHSKLSRHFLLFLIFVVISVNSNVFAGEAKKKEKKNQTHKKYIAAMNPPGVSLKKEKEQPCKGWTNAVNFSLLHLSYIQWRGSVISTQGLVGAVALWKVL